MACSPHSGIAGDGKLVCAFCAALQGLTLKTVPLGDQDPDDRDPDPDAGDRGPGGRGPGNPDPNDSGPGGPGGGAGLEDAGAPAPGSAQDAHTASSIYLPEPAPLRDIRPFESLDQALHELPGLYRRGKNYSLPDDMQPHRLVEDANRGWHGLYGTHIRPQSVDLSLAAAAVGLVLWAAGVPERESLRPEEADLPWMVRVPLLRVAIGQREYA